MAEISRLEREPFLDHTVARGHLLEYLEYMLHMDDTFP